MNTPKMSARIYIKFCYYNMKVMSQREIYINVKNK